MKHLQIITLCLFLAIGASAQNFSDSTIITLLQEIKALKSADKRLDGELANQKKRLQTFSESVNAELETNKANIQVIGDSLGIKIAVTEQNTQTKIADVTESVGKKSLFAGIGGIVLLLLSVALFLWLYRRQKSNSADIIKQLEKTKSSIDEKLVAELAKNAEIMQSLVGALRATPLPNGAQNGIQSAAPDHSLALKLADEITLMERNISHMEQNTKGLKPLIRAIERLKSNLNSNGYEFIELIGKQYNEGMKISIVSSIPDENADKGVDIITKVIKPQVNYQDKMIQMAQVEVTVGVN